MAISQEAKKKLFVIVVAILFLGSIGGIGLSGIGQLGIAQPSSGSQAKLPSDRILTSLSGEQQAAILSSGGVIIYLTSPPNCEDCVLAERDLESVTNSYNPVVWLVKQAGANFSVNMIFATKSQEITALPLNKTAVEDFICTNIPVRIQQCILRKI